MVRTRRAFLTGRGGEKHPATLSALVAARGFEGATSGLQGIVPPSSDEVRINGNENPLGPGERALEALLSELDRSNRYPFNTPIGTRTLVEALAKKYRADPNHFVVGVGSSEILANSVRVSCGGNRHAVTASPSYGSPVLASEKYGNLCRQIPVDGELRLDLDAMAAASRGAGLVYVCNPNNPTGTLHPASAVESFVANVHRTSPETWVVVDEAYHDYVTDPAHRTMIPTALNRRNLIVARTFSKAHGMAGLRLGYAVGHPETIEKLSRYRLMAGDNVPALAAAVASLGDQAHIDGERERNAEVRRFTIDFFRRAGYRAPDTQANFVFVNLGRPAKEFREACAGEKVFVGRDFPPFEKTHCRISFGTMAEMRRATEVFERVL